MSHQAGGAAGVASSSMNARTASQVLSGSPWSASGSNAPGSASGTNQLGRSSATGGHNAGLQGSPSGSKLSSSSPAAGANTPGSSPSQARAVGSRAPPAAARAGSATGQEQGSANAQKALLGRAATEPIGTGSMGSLADDPHLMVSLMQEDLDVMDHELFEPLTTLDKDMQEICIDIVNEKVRRILSVDPTKFKGGKLPFGLRADKDDSGVRDKLQKLEGEFEQLSNDNTVLRLERESLTKQLEEAQAAESAQAELAKTAATAQVETSQPGPGKAESSKGQAEKTDLKSQAKEQKRMEHSAASRGPTPEQVEAQIREAVDSAKKDFEAKHQQQIKRLSTSLEDDARKLEAKVKLLEKAVDESKETARENLQRALRAEEDLKGTWRKVDLDGDEQQSESRKNSKGSKKESALKQDLAAVSGEKTDMERRLQDAIDKLAGNQRNSRKFHAKVQENLLKFHELINMKQESPLKKRVEEHLKKDEDVDKSAAALQDWGDEIHQYLKIALKQAQTAAAAAKGDKFEPVEPETVIREKVVEKTVEVFKADPEQAQEIMRLNKRLNKQQDEISRLLVTIDELRSRIESVKDVAAESTPEVQAVIQTTMKKAGLKEIMEAANVPKLKGVFERLYQDAVQRIQRLGLIRERMLIANKAYSNIVNAIASKEGEALDPKDIPDLDRLSGTAAATLSGMWYHTDFLFKNACEYAIAQGVESSIMKSQKLSLSEVIEAGSGNGSPPDALGTDPNNPDYKPRRQKKSSRPNDRPMHPVAGDRPGKALPGVTCGGPGDGHAFWHPMPGGLSKGTKSPREIRKGHLADPEASSFSSYIAALREARGDLKSDEWSKVPLPERKILKSEGVEFQPKTLKASVAGGNARSLPVLPKGRGMLQQAAIAQSSPNLPDMEACENDRDF